MEPQDWHIEAGVNKLQDAIEKMDTGEKRTSGIHGNEAKVRNRGSHGSLSEYLPRPADLGQHDIGDSSVAARGRNASHDGMEMDGRQKAEANGYRWS